MGWVYLVCPRRASSKAGSRIFSDVGRSGSPMVRSIKMCIRDRIQNEQLFYLYCAVVALGCGLLVLFFMCLLGRRVHLEQPFRYSLRGKPKKPRYTAPILLLLFGASALWWAIYYGAPLFHPDWVRVKRCV